MFGKLWDNVICQLTYRARFAMRQRIPALACEMGRGLSRAFDVKQFRVPITSNMESIDLRER